MSVIVENSSGAAGVQVIARSADILRALNGKPDGLSLSEISAAVELPRSTVHRIIGALSQESLVMSVGPTGGYRLGPEILRLATAERLAVRAEVHPLLERLSAQSKESVDLGVLVGDQVYFVDQAASSAHPLRVVSAVGESFPAWCDAGGKALLSHQSDDKLRRILPKKLPAFTANSITDIDELLAEIETIRKTGVSYSREEYTEGICALAAVVAEGFGPVLSLGISVPVQRFYGNEETLSKLLLRTAKDIRRELQHMSS